MSGNTFGKLFRVTTFGESHGVGLGGVIDGCPAGITIDRSLIKHDLLKRKATTALHSTTRFEDDEPEIISGIFEGRSTGSPIAFFIRNRDQDTKSYVDLKNKYRPGHGDFSWDMKYKHFDYRGGGRYSARETAARVVAGAIAKQFIMHEGATVKAWVSGIGGVNIEGYGPFLRSDIEDSHLLCPDKEATMKMQERIKDAADSGDTLGGVISATISGIDAGLGEPVFDKIEAELAKAMMSIPSVKAFAIGEGFNAANMLGSEHSDNFTLCDDGEITMKTNSAGGTLGGISTGNNINFKVGFKPVSSTKSIKQSVTKKGEPAIIDLTAGRHDVCVLPRAVVVVEAMAAIVIADMTLRNRSARL